MADNFHLYKSIVYQTLPRANFIWTPAVSGAKQNVILAQESGGDTYAFKFSNKDHTIRNANIARALRNAGVPAPEIVAQHYDGQWFEVYPAIGGETLYERIGDGVSRTELKQIYSKLLKLFEKMSSIDFSDIYFGNSKYAYQTAYNDTTMTNGALLGNLTAVAVRLMNIVSKSNRGLYHHGLTPKNILVSKRGEITGLVDIDEVGICNPNYAFGVMAAKASLIGIDIKALCAEYERMTGQKLNNSQIAAIVGIQNLGRNILYRTKSK